MGKARVRAGGSPWLERLLLLGGLCLVLLPLWHGGRGVDAGAVAGAAYGPYGPEGPRLREQLWIVPGADPKVPLRATVFRPAEIASARERAARPLVVINHGSEAATREAVAMPVFYWLSRWFVDRGYVVVLPQRRGHGATGGELAEGRDTCANPDHHAAGLAAAADVDAVVRYMAGQSFVDRSQVVVAGVSTGGWASLALAAMNTPGVRLVVNFAGGRGGHAYGQAEAVCGRDRLIEAAGAYGQAAKVPTLWIYAANDSYFGPELAASMHEAWVKGGGRAELRMLPAYGAEGHEVVSDQAGWRLWGGELEQSLARLTDGRQVRMSGMR
jgi:dienelactone hydrolase